MPSRERGHFYGLHAGTGTMPPDDHVCRGVNAFAGWLDIVGLSFERAEAGAQALT